MDHDLSQYLKSYVDRKKITHLYTFLLVNKNYLKQIHEINSVKKPEVPAQVEEVKSSSAKSLGCQKKIVLEMTQNILNLYKKTKISKTAKRRKPYLLLAEIECSDNLIDNANKFNELFQTPDQEECRLVYFVNFHAHWMKTLCYK